MSAERSIEPSSASGPPPWLASAVKWASVVVAAVGLLLIMGALPIREGILAMEGWLHSFGLVGPVIYALIYAALVVLFVPGLPLTVAAGLIFAGVWPQPWGLLIATLTVVLGSNTGAAIALLIGRYLARDRVAAMARASGKFAAVDRAIQEGGWRIVAMLRLSPVVPFNLQNYFYGLTPIRFWTCVLTSIVAMLPGTFLYVYIGYLIRAAAGTAGSENVQLGKWALLGLGLVATIAVTVYVTRLANRALKQRPELEEEGSSMASEQEATASADRDEGQPAGGWRGAIVAAVVGGVLLLAGGAAQAFKGTIQAGLFGPPAVVMQEAYAAKPDGPSVDHSLWDQVVSKHVDEAGFVDYQAIKQNPAALNQYIDKLANIPFDQLGRDEKLAVLINAYNAFTIKLILDHWQGGQLQSIKDIPASERWKAQRWQIGSHTWSLDQIEHEQIRPKFKEPRIHFAVVCAAFSCPPLRTEAYTAEKIDQQLQDQTRYVHNHDRWFRYDATSNTVHLTKLYDWYGGDFEQTAGSVLQYVAQYSPKVKQALADGKKPDIEWINYSWKLNDKVNKSLLTSESPQQ
jgi:uncharacterized membrane protein YdjX (TVP38/TMEM64 family)